MIGGAYGKVLHVDLTTSDIWVEQPEIDFYRLRVGGRAVVACCLLRDLAPGTDALSPDNLLNFAPGLMQGSNLPGAGRHGVGGMSPLTGGIGSSEAGGWWGHEYRYDHRASALSGVTGLEFTVDDILFVGARAQTLARLFNLREGLTAADDRLPRRVMKAFESGPLAGIEFTPDALAWARQRYYELMQWDPETGIPSVECVAGLGIPALLNQAVPAA